MLFERGEGWAVVRSLERRTPLRSNPDTVRAFNERARRNSKMGRTANGRPKQTVIGIVTPKQRAWARSLPCLGCGHELSEYRAIDFAHIWPGAMGGHCGSILDGFPLCRVGDGSGCHRCFDQADPEPLDLLPTIIRDWARWRFHVHHAIRHAENPVLVIERLAGARTQWSEVIPAGTLSASEGAAL